MIECGQKQNSIVLKCKIDGKERQIKISNYPNMINCDHWEYLTEDNMQAHSFPAYCTLDFLKGRKVRTNGSLYEFSP